MTLNMFLGSAALGLAVIAAPTIAGTTQDAGMSSDSPATIDSNADGKPDAWDTNGDSRADAWDTDGDGKPDTVDGDGDGKPDAAPKAE